MSGNIARRLSLAVNPDGEDFDEALADAIILASYWPYVHRESIIELWCGTVVLEVNCRSEYLRMCNAYYDAVEAGGHVVIGPDAVARPRASIDPGINQVGWMLFGSVKFTDVVIDGICAALEQRGGERKISPRQARRLAEAIAAGTSLEVRPA